MEEKRKLQPWLMWLAVAMVLLVYLVGSGPVVLLAARGKLDRSVLRLYYPLTEMRKRKIQPFAYLTTKYWVWCDREHVR